MKTCHFIRERFLTSRRSTRLFAMSLETSFVFTPISIGRKALTFQRMTVIYNTIKAFVSRPLWNTVYATQWLQVQCLAFRDRFKDLNNYESKCLFCGHCGIYAIQWLQVQCLAFHDRFKDLNNCSQINLCTC